MSGAFDDAPYAPYLSFQDSINSSSLESPPSPPRPIPPSSSFVSPISAPSYAVYVRGLSRSYGKALVLHHLHLTVPTGCIYGLLGPSGCGKTTLLKVLTGRLRAHGGAVRVLDCVPGAPGSRVPGGAVGFMPQELALYEEFSIHQNFAFYGRLFGLSSDAIQQREAFLLSFLHIPPASRTIKQLSGGQQRRVSLACALLHSPPLLLLDEPTVGVDPLLRSRIWSHLRTLSLQGVTVVITTHYIEEARQADYVGFMRGGKILQEGRPSDILAQYRSDSLEDVFLRLCSREDGEDGRSDEAVVEDEARADDEAEKARQQRAGGDGGVAAESKTMEEDSGSFAPAEQRPAADDSLQLTSTSTSMEASCVAFAPSLAAVDPLAEPLPPVPWSDSARSYLPRPSFLLACMWRNFTRFRNNLPALLFVFLLPSIQVILFCIAIGKVASAHKPLATQRIDRPHRGLTPPRRCCGCSLCAPLCRCLRTRLTWRSVW